MGEFRFSELPWFIREEIIYYVVSVGKQYSLVSSEWLKYTAFRFGQCRTNGSEHKKLPDILTKNFGSVWLDNPRIKDWDFLNSLKNIKKVTIGSNFVPDPLDALLPQYIGVFKPERLIKAHQDSLEVLAVCNSNLKHYDIIDNTIFPNLTFFELTTGDDPFPFSKISTEMPRLKVLHIKKLDEDPIFLPGHVFENIIELKINVELAVSYPEETLDLSSFSF